MNKNKLEDIFRLVKENPDLDIVFLHQGPDFNYYPVKIDKIVFDETTFFETDRQTIVKSLDYNNFVKRWEHILFYHGDWDLRPKEELKKEAIRRANNMPWKKSIVVYLEDEL